MATPNFAGGHHNGRALLLQSSDGKRWVNAEIEQNDKIVDLESRNGNLFIAFEGGQLAWKDAEDDWNFTSVAALRSKLYALAITESGTAVITGNTKSGILTSRSQLGLDHLMGISEGPVEVDAWDGTVSKALSDFSVRIIGEIKSLQIEASRLREQENKLTDLVFEISDTRSEQLSIIESVNLGRIALDEAFRKSEIYVQISWMATRIALIILLIFLIQIVLNRYRYLQRLSVFYHARAQAFDLISSVDPDTEIQLLDGVTMIDLINALSPDSIVFDKSPSSVADNFSNLFRGALKTSAR